MQSNIPPQVCHGYIMFTDLKGFSALDECELQQYHRYLLPALSKRLASFKDSPNCKVWNTWGDALVAVLTDEQEMAELMLSYRDFFRNFKYPQYSLTPLKARIAGHFGRFDIFPGLAGDGHDIIGTNVITAARLEPVTLVDEVYVTEAFKNSFEASPLVRHDCQGTIRYAFDPAGCIDLAKGFAKETVFRLRYEREASQEIQEVLHQNLSTMLPAPTPMQASEEHQVKQLKTLEPEALKARLMQLLSVKKVEAGNMPKRPSGASDEYCCQLAYLCKDAGLYTLAINFISRIKADSQKSVDGMNLSLLKAHPKLLKCEANCLTRLGQYQQASEILYPLIQSSSNQDFDALCMLAAQYKRRALIHPDNTAFAAAKDINWPLLERALCLYLEALRLSHDYYPAINLMYLFDVFAQHQQQQRLLNHPDIKLQAKQYEPNKMAQFIQQFWGTDVDTSSSTNTNREGDKSQASKPAKPDWWLASTLFEAKLYGSTETGKSWTRMITLRLLDDHQPNAFQVAALADQLDLQSHFSQSRREVWKEALKVLRGH